MKLPNGESIQISMPLDNSEVMNEFFRIAMKVYAEDDKKTIEEKTIEVDEDIIEKAHPEPIYVAEALGDGGLVENQNEQQKKDIDIVNKMPTGALIHIYADCFNDLIKLAEECEACGELETAELVIELANGVLDRFPFVAAPKQIG